MLKLFSKIVRSTDSLWFHFTKKTNKRCKWFIPTDVSKEIGLFKREIEHSNERAFILKGHVWSENFRKWMIENKMFELAFDIESDAEMISLFNSEAPRPIMVKVLKEHTPSNKVLDSLNYTNEYIQKLFCEVPEAFKNVSCERIIDINELVEVIIEKAIKEKDTYLMYKYLRHIILNKKPYDNLVATLWKFAASHDYKSGINDYIPCLRELFPNSYVWIRENIDNIQNKEIIISKAFEPKNLPQGIDIKDINDIKTTGRLDSKADALAWLKIAYNYVNKRVEVFDAVFNALGDIKKVNSAIFAQICERMCGYSKANCPEFVEKVEPVHKLKVIYRWNTYVFIDKYFPFTDWPENLQKSALRVMAKQNRLDIQKLNQLPADLRKYALEQLEINAQIATVERGTINDVKALCSCKRSDEVEVAIARIAKEDCLATNYQDACQLAIIAKTYLLNFDISPQAFAMYIKVATAEHIREYIRHKKCLTQIEYDILITSHYSFLAANATIKQDNN